MSAARRLKVLRLALEDQQLREVDREEDELFHRQPLFLGSGKLQSPLEGLVIIAELAFP